MDPKVPVCCTRRLEGHGYTCCHSAAGCCGGNKCCKWDERCIDPLPGGVGGYCAPKCALQYGPNWKDCGVNCCQPHEKCENGKCVSCEKEGKQSCQPFGGGAVICCTPGTRCCANAATTACCGPRQTCRADKTTVAKCACPKGTKRCGHYDCCRKSEECCGRAKCCPKGKCCNNNECCDKDEICAANGCCPKDRATCAAAGGGKPTCCGPGEYCLWKGGIDPTTGDVLAALVGVCKKGCAPGNRAGTQCCGAGYRPNPAKTACVFSP
jgi:hypothetical protein